MSIYDLCRPYQVEVIARVAQNDASMHGIKLGYAGVGNLIERMVAKTYLSSFNPSSRTAS